MDDRENVFALLDSLPGTPRRVTVCCQLCENTSHEQFVRPDYPGARTGVCIDHEAS